jgi:mercuric ion transport protein
VKSPSLVITAIVSAILSTTCCLPALIFLVFGVSAGSLSFLTDLGFLRIPMAIISIILLLIYVIKKRKSVSCSCSQKLSYKSYISIFAFSLIIAVLLFYPEFSVYFVE